MFDASDQNLTHGSHLDGSTNDENWDIAVIAGRVAEWLLVAKADVPAVVRTMLPSPPGAIG